MHIDLKFYRSKRAKNIRISINRLGEVKVIHPWYVPRFMAQKFAESKKDWIEKKVEKMKEKSLSPNNLLGERSYSESKDEALKYAKKLVEKINKHYGFKYGKVSVKNQKTRWGSCSSKGNLNFNYRILFLPKEMADYLVVHELCHLKEMNHGKRFWALVEETVPDYKEVRKKLKNVD